MEAKIITSIKKRGYEIFCGHEYINAMEVNTKLREMVADFGTWEKHYWHFVEDEMWAYYVWQDGPNITVTLTIIMEA